MNFLIVGKIKFHLLWKFAKFLALADETLAHSTMMIKVQDVK